MREGWKNKKLGEVCFYPKERIALSEISANQYVGVETLVKDRGGVSFGDSLPSADSAIKFIKDDVLIGNIRPYLRKIWMSDRNGGASGDIIVVRVSPHNKDSIISPYLFKVLSSNKFFEYDNAHTHGAKMPRGDRNSIADYIIPVPPLSEQQRIVSELDLLSGIIEKKKEQLKEYDKLAQSIFYDMFGEEKAIKCNWEKCRVGDIYRFQYGKGNNIPEDKGDYPCYGSNGVVGHHITFNSEDAPIIGHIGAYAGIVNWGKGKHYVTYNGVICKLIDDCNNPVYGYYMLKSQDYLTMAKRGGAQPFVSYDLLEEPTTYIPPLYIQQSFAEKIETIEKQKELIKQSIVETETLFNSRMDYYFN